jgi:hypothetical protein
MSKDYLNKEQLLEALELTGKLLDWPSRVEIFIVGGAAGALLGVWAPERVTEDCDIVEISPPVQPRRAVLQAAMEAAEKLEISPHWLNDDFKEFGTLDTLPDAWRTRVVAVGTFDNLSVVSLCRRDLLATKLYAGRPQDIEDIYSQLNSITAEDIAFLHQYIESLDQPWRKHINKEQLTSAVVLLEQLEREASL